jgi:hypothetical protein
MSSKNSIFDASYIVTDALLAITQSIGQNYVSDQIVSIECNNDPSSNYCVNCINGVKNILKDPKDIEEVCSMSCKCNVDNIKLSSQINLNMDAFFSSDVKEDFRNQVMNSISQRAESSKTDIFGVIDNRNTNLVENIDKIYASMRTGSFQSDMSLMKTLQTVILKNPGSAVNIDMTQVSNFISKIIKTNKDTSQTLNDLQTSIIQITTQITNAGISQLIIWMVRCILIVFVIIVLAYGINVVFQIYSLYVNILSRNIPTP